MSELGDIIPEKQHPCVLYLVTEQASCSSLAPRLQLSNKVKLCVKLKVRMAGEAGCLLVSPQQIDLLF